MRVLMSHGDVEYVEVGPTFGTALPHGSCNARVENTVCGWPRRFDGTCTQGHPAQPKPSLQRDERGAIAIMTAFLMVVLLILAGFAVDFGQAYVNKRQMQTAADSAALAAASVYTETSGTCAVMAANPVAKLAAQGRADDFREQNAPGAVGDPITVACVGGALQVTADSSRSTPSLFGPLAGVGNEITVSRTATASVSTSPGVPGGMRPLALCAAQIPSPAITGTVVRIDYPGDGHKAFPGCPETDNPGSWWTLDCPTDDKNATGGTKELEDQIKNGCEGTISIVDPQNSSTPASLSKSLTDACPSVLPSSETCMSGDPGSMDAGQIEDSWRYLIDHHIRIVLPVFCVPPTCNPTTVVGTGTSAIFPVYRLASMEVCGYHFGKTTRYDLFSAACLNHGTLSAMLDTTKDNYLLVVFKAVQTSGGTKDYVCDLGSACDLGLRRTLLVN